MMEINGTASASIAALSAFYNYRHRTKNVLCTKKRPFCPNRVVVRWFTSLSLWSSTQPSWNVQVNYNFLEKVSRWIYHNFKLQYLPGDIKPAPMWVICLVIGQQSGQQPTREHFRGSLSNRVPSEHLATIIWWSRWWWWRRRKKMQQSGRPPTNKLFGTICSAMSQRPCWIYL